MADKDNEIHYNFILYQLLFQLEMVVHHEFHTFQYCCNGNNIFKPRFTNCECDESGVTIHKVCLCTESIEDTDITTSNDFCVSLHFVAL